MYKKIIPHERHVSILSVILIVLLPLMLASAIWAVEESFTGKCVSVHDGDTIGVMHNGKEEKIRVYGIDSPELHQDFGSRAKQFTSDMAFGKTVTVEIKSHDRYGRTVGRVNVEGKDLSLELAKAGMAWYYKKYANDPELAKGEKDAQTKKLGLWSMSNPTPPWEFRKNKNGAGTSNNSKSSKSLSRESNQNAVAIDTTNTSHGQRIIYTGPNGGKYYVNKKGNKVYIK